MTQRSFVILTNIISEIKLILFCSASAHQSYSVAQIPGLLKIRYVGRATVSTAVAFGLFMGAGSLIHSGRSN
jgi:hypothetical protein